jgi:hypothetical protein
MLVIDLVCFFNPQRARLQQLSVSDVLSHWRG